MPYADTIDICGTDVIGKNADLIMDEYEVVIMGLGYLWWTPNDDYELPDKLQEARASIVDPYHCQYKSMICLIGFGQSGLCYGIWVTSPLRRYLLITNSKISIKGNYRKMIFQATVELQQFWKRKQPEKRSACWGLTASLVIRSVTSRTEWGLPMPLICCPWCTI